MKSTYNGKNWNYEGWKEIVNSMLAVRYGCELGTLPSSVDTDGAFEDGFSPSEFVDTFVASHVI